MKPSLIIHREFGLQVLKLIVKSSPETVETALLWASCPATSVEVRALVPFFGQGRNHHEFGVPLTHSLLVLRECVPEPNHPTGPRVCPGFSKPHEAWRFPYVGFSKTVPKKIGCDLLSLQMQLRNPL